MNRYEEEQACMSW